MKMIDLITKGNNTICIIKNNDKINYVRYKNIKDELNELCLNYNEINITEKNINISNSKLNINIENYKENTNIFIIPIIENLQKDFRKLKQKELKKQKIKRISALSCAVIISGGLIVNALSNDQKDDISKVDEINNRNIIVNEKEETTEYYNENFIIEEKENDNLVYEKNITNTINYEINFESRVNDDKFRITNAYYNEMITNISNEYGIDPRIMIAIATQESGIHNPNLKGSAIGLMQIERAVWNGKSLSAYNYAKDNNETLKITEEKLNDLEFNIRAACMILRDCLNRTNYNLPVAIQMYNFGYGNMNKVFKTTYGYNINFEEACIDCDNNWLEYRETIKDGDNKYLEHILSYIEELEDIQIKKGDEIVSYNFINRVKIL